MLYTEVWLTMDFGALCYHSEMQNAQMKGRDTADHAYIRPDSR